MNKKQNLLKTGSVLTKSNIGVGRSPRTDDSYDDGEYETTHQLLQSNKKTKSKSGVSSSKVDFGDTFD